MRENIIVNKTVDFSLKIIKLYKYLCEEKKEYIMSKQILRSGTSIGANVREAVNSQSKKEFIAKMNISLKEVSETEYWLELLIKSNYIDEFQAKNIVFDCSEIAKIIISIIKTSNNQK